MALQKPRHSRWLVAAFGRLVVCFAHCSALQPGCSPMHPGMRCKTLRRHFCSVKSAQNRKGARTNF